MLEQNKAPSKVSTDTSSARRGFLKKAAISAPILTTIAARPVWAGQCSLSGNLSNNVSNHEHQAPCSILGYSHGYWGNLNSGKGSVLFGYLARSIDDNLASFFIDLGYPVPASFQEGTPAKIVDALARGNANHGVKGNLGVGNWGLWQQRTTAFLNVLLWNYLKEQCTDINDIATPNCAINYVDSKFYYPWTFDDVWSKSQFTLESALF